MHEEINPVAETDYQSTINRGITIRMRQHMGLRRSSLDHHTGFYASSQVLNDILDQPLDDGIITVDEALEILRTDFVVAGASAGRTAYALGETSLSLRRGDITRARERADLLAKATGATVRAFAISPDEPAPEHGQLAQQLDVTIIVAPDPNSRNATPD